MKIYQKAIHNPVFAWMLMLGVILFGLISAKKIGISEMPDVDFPVVNISITYPGAAPEIIETDVVDIVEESVLTIEGIRSINSSSRQERGNVTIEFDLGRDIDVAVREVESKLAQAQRRLPDDIDPPVVTKTNPEDQPIMWVSLSAHIPLRQLIEYARDHIKDKLQTISGVGEIILSGYVEPNLRLWIKPDKLKQYDLTVQDVIQAIQQEHVEIPAGRIETQTTEYSLRFLGEALSPEEFENILITSRGGKSILVPIKMKEVAQVERGLAEVRRISRTNGIPAVGLGIRKQRGSNSVSIAHEVKARLEQIQKTLPEGYKVQVNFDKTIFIEDSVNEMKFELVLAAILTGFICYLFFATFKSTINILLAIPFSIIGSFMFISLAGFTFNNFTLLALTLSVGIVVDDAIMVLENIVRHQEMGKSTMKAAIEGTREVAPAAFAATIAILAIFVPVVFMEGIIGRFFFQFGIALSVTVALSLIEALTLTPMRSSRIRYKSDNPNRWAQKVEPFFESLSEKYLRGLRFCIHHRWKVLIGSFLFFLLSLTFLFGIKREFVPLQDQSAFLVMVQTKLGSSIHYTDEVIKKLESKIATIPELKRYFVAVGGFGGTDSNKGIMFITLKDKSDRPVDPALGRRASQQEIMNRVRKQLAEVKEARTIFQDLSSRGFSARRGFPIEFTVRGPDWDTLAQASQNLQKTMEESSYFTDVDSDYLFGQPEVRIYPNRQAAQDYGVRIDNIGSVIAAMIGGVDRGKFTEAGRRYDVRIRLQYDYRSNPDDIKNLYVRNAYGELISLDKVVRIEEKQTLSSITRADRERAIEMFANVGTAHSQKEAIEEVQRLANEKLPEGYRIVLSGSSQTFQQSFQSLLFAMILGIIVAYMVLASQYNSYIHPITVLLALPFSLSGAFVALWLFGQSLNVYSFIGIILLMGIAKKNSILLVDYTNQRREEGLDLEASLLKACPQRLRPILMTSITMITAAIPTALGLGPGSEVRMPMSLVIIGGMIFSTFLTLFVVPCSYHVMARFERKLQL